MAIADDKRALKNALTELETVLVEVADPNQHLLSSDLGARAQKAWPEVQAALGQVRQGLDGGTKIDTHLIDAGLTGDMLDLKLHGFQQALAAWRSSIAVARTRLLRRVLRWANIFLGSLASFLPPAEVVKEYKEALEAGVDEADGS